MEKEQVREWSEAQKITVSIDLVEAAKTHLKFLAAVERNRFLYEDDVLQRAIYRYNAFWLPLLAKHLENPVSEGSLVVPLDCELIWHCHRLNPIRYKFDCEKLFGRILGNHKVTSSIQAASKSTTEEIWNKMYPGEPYELDLLRPFSGNVLQNSSENEKFTSYDLVAAVKRQMSFTYQASRPHMSDELFLQEALGRYKGFLQIIRTNRKMSLKRFSVPTYDIDLMWHTHQLYPDSYYKDMNELVGYVVQHNDSDPDKSKGSTLDTGFHETTRQWEQIFGFSYWKAGAMYRGNIPTPVTRVPYQSNVEGNELNSFEKCGSQIQFPTLKAVEVLLEFMDIKNLPEENKENLLVAFSKKNQADKVFNAKRWLGISSASKDKLFALFQCEPTGEFLFELMSYSPTSNELKPNKPMNILGSCSLSFEELVSSQSQLSINKWVAIDLVSGQKTSEPVLLHVSMSFSPPMPAPQLFQLVRSQTPENDQIQAYVMDYRGKNGFSLQKRNIIKDATKCTSDLLTEVYCIPDSGEKYPLVEFQGNYWSVKGTHGSFKLQNSSAKDDSLLELVGSKMVKLFTGRRLEFEPKNSEDKILEENFTTLVEFSTDYPYGRAVALINSKSGTIKTVDESIVLPGIALTFILSDVPKGEDKIHIHTDGKDMVKNEGFQGHGSKCSVPYPCSVEVGDILDLVKATDCACGPCKVALPQNEDMVKNEGFQGHGSKCYVGPCSPCGGGNLALVKATDCACGPCKDALPKNEAYGAQCIGQCANCDDMEKAAACGTPPCLVAEKTNDEYGDGFNDGKCNPGVHGCDDKVALTGMPN